ncbi:hypothetical protein [Nostoc sp.]|uniref:hypothetical protein n=1 Tax=Nostoc sp. TaxID=1180 RepID=UPI002FFD2724
MLSGEWGVGRDAINRVCTGEWGNEGDKGAGVDEGKLLNKFLACLPLSVSSQSPLPTPHSPFPIKECCFVSHK